MKQIHAQASVTVALWTRESGIVAQYYGLFGKDGFCYLDTEEFKVVWPAPGQGPNRIFDSNMTLVMTLTDLSGNGLQFSTIEIILVRTMCPAGSAYSPLSRTCVICLPSQYGVLYFQKLFLVPHSIILIFGLLVQFFHLMI